MDNFDAWLRDVNDRMFSFPLTYYVWETDEVITIDKDGKVLDRYWPNSWDDWAD